MNNTIDRWMSWEGGVDLAACTRKDLAGPNVIVHLARLVHTPAGSAPAGMIFWQPDPTAAPVVMGFVSSDPATGAYFGPKIFAGTPFENAPALPAKITITTPTADSATAVLEAGGHKFEVTMRGLAKLESIERAAGAATPFSQSVIEAVPASVELKVDGKPVEIFLPPVGISGGPAAVWSPCGIYAR